MLTGGEGAGYYNKKIIQYIFLCWTTSANWKLESDFLKQDYNLKLFSTMHIQH